MLAKIHFLVEPQPQLLRVRQAGDVVGIRRVLERRVRLVGVLDGVAERVVIHTRALARHGAVERSEHHAGRGGLIRHDADAAVRPAEAAEGPEDPVSVYRRQVQIALGPGVGDADVPMSIPSPEQEVAVDRPRDPLGSGLPSQPAPGT